MGTNLGCDCIGIYDRWIHGGGGSFSEGLACGYNETKYGCKQSNPIPPTILGKINGEKVCGKRAPYSFVYAKRPIKDGEIIRCPDNHTHCGDPGDMPID